MKNYLDDMKIRTFEVFESNGYTVEKWYFTGTNREMKEKLEGKRDFNGYISGVGGNKKYSIYAVELLY